MAWLPDELLGLAQPLQALEPDFAVVEHREHLALAHEVAGPDGRLLDVAVERRHRGQARTRFHHGARGHTVLAAGQHQEQHDRRRAGDSELEAGVGRTDERLEVSPAGVGRLHRQPAVVAPLNFQHGAGDRRQHLEELDRHRVERPIGRALAGQGTDEPASLDQRDRADRGGLGLSRELRVRPDDARLAARPRRVDHGALLVDRLVHGGADRAHQVRLLAEVGAVRDGPHPDASALDEADAHALAAEPRRHRRDEGRRGAVECS
jgi:hypothetical protein